MEQLRDVDIIISNKKTNDKYYARSYPCGDSDGDGVVDLYEVPVYYVYVKGGDNKSYRWKALRFMPYYKPSGYPSDYKAIGWVNCGLHKLSRQPAPKYIPSYVVHNTYSRYNGAIVLKGTFYIHAGPFGINYSGWGSAGCVEIVGDFNLFKDQIKVLSGSTKDIDSAISELVREQKLYVTVEDATPPALEKNRIQ